jgi:hypothetical protein
MKIIRTTTFTRRAAKLLTDAEIMVAQSEIAADPLAWPIIQGTGGCRKARAARGNSGKSGGVRVIYFFWASEDSIYLLAVYAKNEQDNISAADKKALRNLVKSLKE